MITGMPDIDYNLCNGCGTCVQWCPTGAVSIKEGKAVIVRSDDCNYCTECESVCPSGAIQCPFEIVLVSGPEQGSKA